MIQNIFRKILMNTTQGKHKVLIVFDDVIGDMMSNKKT